MSFQLVDLDIGMVGHRLARRGCLMGPGQSLYRRISNRPERNTLENVQEVKDYQNCGVHHDLPAISDIEG